MSQPIVFYDIASKRGTWSSNTWKIKLVLEYKKLPYNTVWVEWPEIEPVCKSIGAAPTSRKGDGSPRYTLPTIQDPNTSTTISDSAMIVRYLDQAYPDTPRLVPAGTSALHAAFDAAFVSSIPLAMASVTFPALLSILNPPSEEVTRKRGEAQFGKSGEQVGTVREERWKALEEAWKKVIAWTSLDGTSQPYFMGDQISFADITVVASLRAAKTILGADHEDWARLEGVIGGRWKELIELQVSY